jgi:hypothetical protein
MLGFSFICSASLGFSGQDVGGVEQDLMIKVVVVFRCGHLLLLLQFDVEVMFINPDLPEGTSLSNIHLSTFAEDAICACQF